MHRFESAANVHGHDELPAPHSFSLPDIDYSRHPAYGFMFANPSLRTKLTAHARFWPNLIFVFVKWLIDYDNLPLLTRHRGGRSLKAFAAIAIPYAGMLVRIQARRLLLFMTGRRRSTPHNAIYTTLVKDGIVALSLSTADKERLREVAAPAFARLRERRAAETNGSRQFEDSRLRTTRREDGELYATCERILDEQGVIQAASAYLAHQVAVKDINPQINDLSDAFWRDQFADAHIPNSRASYMHTDAGYGVLKLIIYLSEVKDRHGPFSYVRGTNRHKANFLEGLIRRANDHAGLSSTSPEFRQLFSALPNFLRKKCALGADIQDGTPGSDWLLKNEWFVKSDSGDTILFDPGGVHRGGMVTDGERVVLTIVLGRADSL